MLTKVLEWLVLLPLWRRVIPDKTWHVPAAVGTGIAWVVVIILFSVTSGGGDDESGATVQDQGTPEPAITATATPEATATPSPTPEATSAPTPEPGLSAIEEAYRDEILAINSNLITVLENTTILAEEASLDPSVLFDEGWFRDLAREQTRLNDAQLALLSLTPPELFARFHDLFVRALTEMDIALDLFESGGRDFDDAKLLEGAGHMDESTRLINEATEALPE